MTVLFDTSVLVASLLQRHQFHEPAVAWLAAARTTSLKMIVSAHSIAEVYSVLTRLPKGERVSSADAWELIDRNILELATIRTLPAAGYVRLVKQLSVGGFAGGVVYDAIIAEVGRLAKSDALLTLNVADFERVTKNGKMPIISPLIDSPPDSTE
ncbi:MAG: PIN domain-containing protein [Planctomycetales bacterium]